MFSGQSFPVILEGSYGSSRYSISDKESDTSSASTDSSKCLTEDKAISARLPSLFFIIREVVVILYHGEWLKVKIINDHEQVCEFPHQHQTRT